MPIVEPSPRNNRKSGQSLIELAISLMVILLLVAGAVDFGMAFFSYVAIRDAAQEGALFGSFDPYVDTNLNGTYDVEGPDIDGDTLPDPEPINDAEIRTRVRQSSRSPVDLQDTTKVPDGYIIIEATTGIACEGSTSVAGVPTPNAIRVTVRYDYPIITPLVGAILGGQTIPLSASVSDTILEPRCP